MKHKLSVHWPLIAVLASTILLLSCADEESGAPTAEATPSGSVVPASGWLEGTADEKLDRVSAHLRGLDMVMVETGHRYMELHWAGEDANWDYAAYQLDKIALTLELGIERRPARAASAAGFLQGAIPHLREAIDAQDGPMFRERFTAFTASCNACHAQEDVPFMEVRPPSERVSPIYGPAASEAAQP